MAKAFLLPNTRHSPLDPSTTDYGPRMGPKVAKVEALDSIWSIWYGLCPRYDAPETSLIVL